MQTNEVGEGSGIMSKCRGNREWSSDPKWLLVTRTDWQTRSGLVATTNNQANNVYEASQPNEATCVLLLA